MGNKVNQRLEDGFTVHQYMPEVLNYRSHLVHQYMPEVLNYRSHPKIISLGYLSIFQCIMPTVSFHPYSYVLQLPFYPNSLIHL